jgi:predicted DNA repair protein MutK
MFGSINNSIFANQNKKDNMASGIFALLDDIAALMDDVGAMSKIAAKKTAGILGDDLAVNAEKASGFVSSRELPVLWAITKGSFLNKIIILPIAFFLTAFIPWLLNLILILGGLYLAFEGAEKIVEFFFPHGPSKKEVLLAEFSEEQILAMEKGKIKSAIITDFILSVEIVIIALGTVADQELSMQIMVVSIIALLAIVGVYGIVALIVRMDEAGYKLIQWSAGRNNLLQKAGTLLVRALPRVIQFLSVVGTLALLFVSGGIFSHQFHNLHQYTDFMPGWIFEFLLGSLVGMICVFIRRVFMKIFKKKTISHQQHAN